MVAGTSTSDAEVGLSFERGELFTHIFVSGDGSELRSVKFSKHIFSALGKVFQTHIFIFVSGLAQRYISWRTLKFSLRGAVKTGGGRKSLGPYRLHTT